jgi:hypothetical protein
MKTTGLGWLLVVGAVGLNACSARSEALGSPRLPMAGSPEYSSGSAQAAPAAPSAASRGESYEARDEERPGLGTGWGENVHSPTRSTSFVREDPNHPFLVSTLYYNDEEGANAMARVSDYRSWDRGWYPIHHGMISVSLHDDSGRRFQSFYAGGRNYVVGEAGSRYVIVLQNNSGYRFECVTSVDGLDVIEGNPASFDKRGYVLMPYSSLEIDGFRRSDDTVAAFRFSSVRGSYSSRSGQGDRNVGVIGIALFQERGQVPQWTDDEVNRRHNADPFPQRYAQPPDR